MRAKLSRKPSPMSAVCRRAQKLRQSRPVSQCICSHALSLPVPANSFSCKVPQLPVSPPICQWKIHIFLEYLYRLEGLLPGNRNWWDSTRTERPTSHLRSLYMLWRNFRLSLIRIGRWFWLGQLHFSRPDLRYLACNCRWSVSTFPL